MKNANYKQYIVLITLTLMILGSVLLVKTEPLKTDSTKMTININDSKKWTIMVYLDADNNLDSYGVDDLNEMEEGLTSSTNINVIVLLDRESRPAKTYEVVYDTSSSIGSTELTTGFSSELDMGDPNTLEDFMEFCIDNYPAENYVLDLWNHGAGWPGICYDDTSGGSHLTLGEVRTVLSNIYTSKGVKMNITAMDACLMGMLEVAYSLNDYSNILIASEESIPGDGFPYDDILSNLVSSPLQSIYSFASNIVDLYDSSYSYYSDVTLSAINLTSGSFSELQTAFDNLTTDMIKEIMLSKINFDSAKSLCQKFSEPSFIDLYDFVDELISIDSKFTVNGTNLMNEINNVIINEKHGSGLPDATGISIYFPTETVFTNTISTYNSLDITGSYWDEFLDSYYQEYNVSLTLSNYYLNDTLGGNNDTVVDQGESINLSITLKNTGQVDALSINGSLSVSIPDSTNISILTAFKEYNALNASSSKTKIFNFNVSELLENGTTVILNFDINATFTGTSGILRKTYKIPFIIGYLALLGGTSISDALEITEGLLIGVMPGPSPTDAGSAYFKINITQGKALNINLTGFDDTTDFDVYLYDIDGDFVSAALSGSYPDLSGVYARETGYHYLRVYPYNGTGLYRLNVSISDTAYEDGRFFGTAFSIQSSGFYSGSADSNSEYPDVFYRYWVDSGAYLKLELNGDPGTDFDLYLYSENFEELDYSERYNYPENIRYWISNSGYVYIIVTPWDGSGQYNLSITIEEEPPIPGFQLESVIISIIIIITIVYITRFAVVKIKTGKEILKLHW